MSKIDDKLLPENIRKFKQDVKDLSILESLKYIEKNEKLNLAEIIFAEDTTKQEFMRFKNKYTDIERLTGLECTNVFSIFRIVISKENTLKELIELLERTLEIYCIKQWRIVDLDTMLMAVFGESLPNLSPINIKDLIYENI